MISFTIAVPTIGRPTLRRTLDSILAAGIQNGDQVHVVGDGHQPDARAIVSEYTGKLPVIYSDPPLKSFWGHPQRNFVYRQATTTHLATIDDDDVYVPGALEIVRKAVEEDPEKLFMFRMESKTSRLKWKILWAFQAIRVGNIGTPMFVVPNVKTHLGTFGDWYGGDFDFVKSTLSFQPDGEASIRWREDVIVDVY